MSPSSLQSAGRSRATWRSLRAGNLGHGCSDDRRPRASEHEGHDGVTLIGLDGELRRHPGVRERGVERVAGRRADGQRHEGMARQASQIEPGPGLGARREDGHELLTAQ